MKSGNQEDSEAVRNNSNQSGPVKGRQASSNDDNDVEDKDQGKSKSHANKGKSQWNPLIDSSMGLI